MVNYKNAKIYKLVNSIATDGNCYYGSTCNDLRFRKNGHKRNYKRWKNGKCRYTTSFKLYEEDPNNIDIILVEKYPCNNKQELHARERYYIERNSCLNKYVPGLTRKESNSKYYKKNKKKIIEYANQYRTENKEKINKKKCEKIECPICKNYTSRCHIRRHQKSKKCQSHKPN